MIAEDAKQIVGFTRNLLDTPDTVREELTIRKYNIDLMPEMEFKRYYWTTAVKLPNENLVLTTKRDDAAIFSVPRAGKTVEALAFSTVVAGGILFS